MMLPALLAALVAAAALLYVARPFFRPSATSASTNRDPAASRRLARVEARDRALAALHEVELDHRTGKISDRDYRELIGQLRRDAVEALRSVDRSEDGRATAASRP